MTETGRRLEGLASWISQGRPHQEGGEELQHGSGPVQLGREQQADAGVTVAVTARAGLQLLEEFLLLGLASQLPMMRHDETSANG